MTAQVDLQRLLFEAPTRYESVRMTVNSTIDYSAYARGVLRFRRNPHLAGMISRIEAGHCVEL